MIEVALIGNPNSGKTSLFNLMTGHNQRVGNWPGVTVERKSGLVKKHKDIEIQDLPGIYSMSPYSPEEKVARDYLLSKRADSILNVVDATNLERNLYLTTQLIETGIPVTLALNMRRNYLFLNYQLGVLPSSLIFSQLMKPSVVSWIWELQSAHGFYYVK